MLKVIDIGQEYRVVYVDDCQDWVAGFDKGLPKAKVWAENMASTYNQRVESISDKGNSKGY